MKQSNLFRPVALLVMLAVVVVASSAWAAKGASKPRTKKPGAPSGAVVKPGKSTGKPVAAPAGKKKGGKKAEPAVVNGKGKKGKKASRPVVLRQGAGVVVQKVSSPTRFVSEGELPPIRLGATCPPDMANIESRYCVDRYEGSLTDLKGNKTSPFEVVTDATKLRAVSVKGVAPQGYISGVAAEQACKNAGKRLCAPVEWRKACYGPENVLYGYGAERQAGRCNDRGRSPMLHYYPQVKTSWKLVGMEEMNDALLNQLDGTLMKTGASAECTNGYGVFDMVGNLHEWTSDPNGTFQGGYYLDTHINGDGCAYRTTAHEFAYHDYSTGFRCCADVSASTSPPAATSTSPILTTVSLQAATIVPSTTKTQ